jgi:hypothetical protein
MSEFENLEILLEKLLIEGTLYDGLWVDSLVCNWLYFEQKDKDDRCSYTHISEILCKNIGKLVEIYNLLDRHKSIDAVKYVIILAIGNDSYEEFAKFILNK